MPFLKQKIKSLSWRAKQLSANVQMHAWKPYSRLFLKNDGVSWSLSHDMQMLKGVCWQLNIPVPDPKLLWYANNQSVFYASRYELFRSRIWEKKEQRLATAYYHGRPGSGNDVFDEMYRILCESHPKIDRIQVTHSEMRDIILESGIDRSKVFQIPIGIDLPLFPFQTGELKKISRSELGIPETAEVVGSFQKDGAGWGKGEEPKLIKGPDIFLETIKILKQKVPELFVLLSGPSRGYVIAELNRLGVPYLHRYLLNYSEIWKLYQALDLYIVTSRQEGGPKALLESMASGVPLVTTKVGQAMDLVQHKKNAWMVDVEDVEGLIHWSEYVLENKGELMCVLKHARKTAKKNSYSAQIHLWRDFMNGFVSWGENWY